MNRQEYFDYLQETSDAVYPVIKQLIEPIKEYEKELYEILMVFIEKRIASRLQKPTLMRLSYEICGGKEWGKIMPAATAFEFINISSYQANSAFDNKLGIFTKPQKDSQFIAAMITRELTQSLLVEIENLFDNKIAHAVSNSLSKGNYYIYLAQHYDLNLLNIGNYNKYQSEGDYLKSYLDRCYYGSGIFNGQCAFVGGLLAGAEEVKLESLRKFGEYYGTALQIINDIGDFVPSGTDKLINRNFQDQYSDFKNGRLTLPLYHLLRFGNQVKAEKIKNLINDKIFDDQTLMGVTSILIEEGSIVYAKEKAREYVKKAEREIQIFDDTVSKQLILLLASMILTNKYFVGLKKMTADLNI